MLTSLRSRIGAATALAMSAVALAGCGSSSSTTSAGGASSTTTASSSSNSQFNPASKARAEAAIAPYTGHPSAFPVSVPLEHKPKAGTTIAFMDCGTPVCALFRNLVTPAAQAMGVKLTVIQAGATASSVNAAFQTVLQQHPNAIINTALDPIEWSQALRQIKAAHIPVITTGVVDGAKYGLTTAPNAVLFGAPVSSLSGKLQADWAYAHLGEKANIQYNWVPELSFSALFRDAFIKEMKTLCPTCKVHTLSIPVADLGSKASQDIVSDLQANPGTNTVVGSNSENLIGLPAALKAAGLSGITTVGATATPVNLQYLKAGEQTVDLALDLPVLSWALVDAATRAANGEPIPASEAAGLPPEQFLTQSDITFNPAKGWTGYPDFAKRFLSLWKAGK